MTTAKTAIAMAALIGAGAGCGYSAPYRTSGPSLSSSGVKVAISAEKCIANPGADPFVPTTDDDLLTLNLKLQVSNQSDRAATFEPARILIAGAVGKAFEVARAQPAADVIVPPGQVQEVSLRFLHRGNLDCEQPLELDLDRAVLVSGQTVALTPIHFVATR